MRNPTSLNFKDPKVFGTILFISLLYIIAGFSFPIISDEFHEAVEVYKLFERIPYKDYFYYKNVLGYYIKYPFLHLFSDWFTSILFSRVVLGLSWVFGLFYFLRKCGGNYSLNSILISFLLGGLLTNNLLHAASYRVDLLTTIFGIFSFTVLRDRKYFIAGLLAAFSFFISQKGIWFCVAGFLSLAAFEDTRKELLPYLRGGFLMGVLYVGLFSIFSSPRDVLYGIFFKDIGMATSAGYQIRHFWSQSFFENWPFWLTSGAGATLLLFKEKLVNKSELAFIFTFLTLFALNPQSWPYNFVFITPFLCYLSLEFWEKLDKRVSSKRIQYFVICICLTVPLYSIFSKHRLTNDHQRALITSLEATLRVGDTYIAGFNLLPKNQQAHSFFNLLSAIERTKAFKMKEVEMTKLINLWEKKPAKALVQNYRTRALPVMLQNYLRKNYSPFWGNLYLRSIKLSKGQESYHIPFDGKYILMPIQNKKEVQAKIVDKEIKMGESISLPSGKTQILVNGPARLMFFPGKLDLSLKHKVETNLNFTYD